MQTIKRVYIPGVWDLFHVGHLNVLQEAKKYGTHLIVGICSDEMCISTKTNPPAIPDKWRREVIDNLKIGGAEKVFVDIVYLANNKVEFDVLLITDFEGDTYKLPPNIHINELHRKNKRRAEPHKRTCLGDRDGVVGAVGTIGTWVL